MNTRLCCEEQCNHTEFSCQRSKKESEPLPLLVVVHPEGCHGGALTRPQGITLPSSQPHEGDLKAGAAQPPRVLSYTPCVSPIEGAAAVVMGKQQQLDFHDSLANVEGGGTAYNGCAEAVSNTSSGSCRSCRSDRVGPSKMCGSLVPICDAVPDTNEGYLRGSSYTSAPQRSNVSRPPGGFTTFASTAMQMIRRRADGCHPSCHTAKVKGYKNTISRDTMDSGDGHSGETFDVVLSATSFRWGVPLFTPDGDSTTVRPSSLLYDDPTSVRSVCSLISNTQYIGRVPSCGASLDPHQTGDAPTMRTFSLAHFSPFYEVAIQQIIKECERRVTNAPTASKEGQKHRLRGGNNYDLSVSSHSFDSPATRSLVSHGTYGSPSSCVGATSVSHSLLSHTGAYDKCGVAGIGPPLAPVVGSGAMDGSRASTAGLLRRKTAFFCPDGAASVSGGSGAQNCASSANSVKALLDALGKQLSYEGTAPMVFLGALVYLSRITAQCSSEYVSVTEANWYRLTTLAVLVASKMYNEQGSHRLNRHVAEAAGMSLREINHLELDFLFLIDFDLLIQESEVESWLVWMESLAARHDLMTSLKSFMLCPTSESEVGGARLSMPVGEAAGCSAAKCSVRTGTASSSVSGRPAHVETTDDTLRSVVGYTGPEMVSHGSPDSVPSCVRDAYTCIQNRPLRTHASAPLMRRHSAASSLAPSNDCLPSINDDYFESFEPCSGLGYPSSVPRIYAGGSFPVVLMPLPIPGHSPTGNSERVFTVVHARREPATPTSVRELCRRGAAGPPSPLHPPQFGRQSPVGFFARGNHSSLGGHRLPPATGRGGRAGHTYASSGQAPFTSTHATPSSSTVARPHSSSGPSTVPAIRASGHMVSVPLSAVTSGSVVPGEGQLQGDAKPPPVKAKRRWASLNIVQNMREVFDVTTSLVRGRLTVLSGGAQPDDSLITGYGYEESEDEEPEAPATFDSPSTVGYNRYDVNSDKARMQGSPSNSHTQHRVAELLPANQWETSPPHDENYDYDGGDEEYYDDEDGNEGYYNDDGSFIYYSNDGEEYEDEVDLEEDENSFFQRCRPPLKHSPPSLSM